jgi:predicted nucleic-acid-binding Zn-ribbon protein
MKFIKSIGLCLFLLTVFGVGAAEVKACAKCATPNFAEAKVRAAAIFVGKVISVTEEGSSKIFEFQVSKTWKGDSKKTVKVTYFESVRYQPIYEVGKEYLMFAESGDDKVLHVYRCSRSAATENAADDLKLLGKAKKSKKVKVKSKK